jgi:hypothetical protein
MEIIYGSHYHTFRTVPKSNRKFVEAEKKLIPLKYICRTAGKALKK